MKSNEIAKRIMENTKLGRRKSRSTVVDDRVMGWRISKDKLVEGS
jgi:hypothetical protein